MRITRPNSLCSVSSWMSPTNAANGNNRRVLQRDFALSCISGNIQFEMSLAGVIA